ncbi:MAG: phosphatase PAP2 family protein [Anaerolineae bacterium]|nr:phosphatase PAP2 family protein [Anaerolineae bacterium]
MFVLNKTFVRIFVWSVLAAIFMLGLPLVAVQEEQIAPEAGTWHTYLLESGSELRLDAPPGDEATAAEIETLQSLLAEVDDGMRDQIRYWSVGSPAYRWNELAREDMANRAMGLPVAIRGLALMNVAIYDGIIAAWDTKYAFNRPRPSAVEPSLETIIATPDSPAYPAEHAVAAAAASEVLAALLPDQADFYRAQAEAAADAMLHSGIYYPSDIEAGMALGRMVAQRAVEWAQNSNFDLSGPSEINGGEGKWNATNPILPLAGTWRPWTLTSGDEFRPGPPPAYGSDELEAEMQELRDMERTPRTNTWARFYEYGAGPNQAYSHWVLLTSQLIWEYGYDSNPPLASLIYTTMTAATYDAVIATWDAKYHYLGIRPFQYDPEFTPVFDTPNHPSYPAAHSVLTSTTLGTLAHWFPSDAEELVARAHFVGESRLWGGIHFRSDIVAGEEIGQKIVERVLTPFNDITF